MKGGGRIKTMSITITIVLVLASRFTYFWSVQVDEMMMLARCMSLNESEFFTLIERQHYL